MTKEIRQYEKGDAPTVRVGYLKGVILQDGTFNCNGLCIFIADREGSPTSCEPADLFVELADD